MRRVEAKREKRGGRDFRWRTIHDEIGEKKWDEPMGVVVTVTNGRES